MCTSVPGTTSKRDFIDFDFGASVSISGVRQTVYETGGFGVSAFRIFGADTYPSCCNQTLACHNVGLPWRLVYSGSNTLNLNMSSTALRTTLFGFNATFRYWRFFVDSSQSAQPIVISELQWLIERNSANQTVARAGSYSAVISSPTADCASVLTVAAAPWSPCPSGYCLNAVGCRLVTATTAECVCAPGFSGTRWYDTRPFLSLVSSSLIATLLFLSLNSQTDINECASQPCRNGATCTDLTNGFNCSCTAGWIGTLCQVRRYEDW